MDQQKAAIRQTVAKHIKFLEKAAYERQVERTTKMEADMKKLESEIEHLMEIEKTKKGNGSNK